jgi:uncharacterized protein HemX
MLVLLTTPLGKCKRTANASRPVVRIREIRRTRVAGGAGVRDGIDAAPEAGDGGVTMRAIVVFALVLLAGCASSGEIQANAYRHQAAANALEARGDYTGAAKERAAAEKQLRKAAQRAQEERSRYYF